MRPVAAFATLILIALACASPARAADVKVIALSQDRATLTIDGGKPKTLRAGETVSGVTLVSASSEEAVVRIGGRQSRLRIGEGVYAAQAPESARASVTLVADARGHFSATGSINGTSVTFLLDTGATLISMGVEDARRAGINYLAGRRGVAQTANGVSPVYRVRLDIVKLGEITLHDVDAIVHVVQPLPVVLLGMSFLGRLDMHREGDTMTLTRRF